MNNNDTIIVMGIDITKEGFPKLYRWAKRNPEGLERTLKSINEKNGGDAKYEIDAINLEMDLQHG